jgi:type III secretion system TyeA family effector delivery regulator
MPVKVFIDMEQRDNVLIAVQDALDELIDEFESGESE